MYSSSIFFEELTLLHYNYELILFLDCNVQLFMRKELTNFVNTCI